MNKIYQVAAMFMHGHASLNQCM